MRHPGWQAKVSSSTGARHFAAAEPPGSPGKHGFGNVTALAPWQDVEADGVTITAAPAKHGVYEVTFVLRAGSDAVYFASDAMLIPELNDIPQQLAT